MMNLMNLVFMKEKGNEFYKSKMMQEALIEYNKAIDYALNCLAQINQAKNETQTNVNDTENQSILLSAQIDPFTVAVTSNFTATDKKTSETAKNESVTNAIIDDPKAIANETKELQIEIAKIYYNIALIHYNDKKYSKCINDCKSAKDFYVLEQINTKLFFAYVKAGLCYKALEVYDTIDKKTKEMNRIINNYKSNEIAEFCKSFNYNDIKISYNEYFIDNSFLCLVIDTFTQKKTLPANFLFLVLKLAYNVFFEADNIVFIDTDKPVYVFGDTHGQFFDTLKAIKAISGSDFCSANDYQLNTEKIYVFNGDFVDRGENSIENITFLYLLKILYPENVFLNRGNHEFKHINTEFGFLKEIKSKYDFVADNYFNLCQTTFACLPIATVINRSVFVVHGGLPEKELSFIDILSINRKVHISDDKILECLMWSDPDEIQGVAPSKRRAGVMFGKDITQKFLTLNNLDFLVRSHEFIQGGIKLNHDEKCVTIFSAPNYCGTIGSASYLCFSDKGNVKVSDRCCYTVGKITANYDILND